MSENLFDVIWNFMETFFEGASNIYTWMLTDLVMGTTNIGKPLYWFGATAFVICIGTWLIGKIIGWVG